MVRQVMKSFGFQPNLVHECLMCKNAEETIDHLLLHCKCSSKIWRNCMVWWGVSWCANKSLLDWAMGWFGLCPKAVQGRAWSTLSFATVWTIWDSMNQMIFRNFDQGVYQAIDMIKFRVVWWFKHHAEGYADSVTVDRTFIVYVFNPHSSNQLLFFSRSFRGLIGVFECLQVSGSNCYV